MAVDQEFAFTDFVDTVEGDPLIEPSEDLVGVMALVRHPNEVVTSGVVRAIVERSGTPAVDGFEDRSKLRHVTWADGTMKVGAELTIEGASEQGAKDAPEGYFFADIEDPSLFMHTRGPLDGLMEVFYTAVARRVSDSSQVSISLGRATGYDLDSLTAQPSVLRNAKEACPGPVNADGTRVIWVESSQDGYSVIRAARAPATFDGRWENMGTIVHPATVKKQFAHFNTPHVPEPFRYAWCAEHISPGQIVDSADLDLGNGLVVMLLNGRSKSQNGMFGPFRVGLGLADPETGRMVWVDPLPLFENTRAENITFLSGWKNDRADAHEDDTRMVSLELSRDTVLARLPRQFLNRNVHKL